MDDEDRASIEAAQAGDAAAFAQLLERHYDRIYRFAYKYCGNASDAEDVAQQACIKLARGLKQFKFESAFSSWLYRLVINCAIDWQRSQRAPERQGADGDGPERGGDGARGENAVYLRQLLAWADQCGDGMKETLLLVFGEGLSHAEAAKILRVKESTVSWRIHSLRQQLPQFQKAGEWP